MIFRCPSWDPESVPQWMLDTSPASQSHLRTERLLGAANSHKATLELLGASLCGRVHATMGIWGTMRVRGWYSLFRESTKARA